MRMDIARHRHHVQLLRHRCPAQLLRDGRSVDCGILSRTVGKQALNLEYIRLLKDR